MYSINIIILKVIPTTLRTFHHTD